MNNQVKPKLTWGGIVSLASTPGKALNKLNYSLKSYAFVIRHRMVYNLPSVTKGRTMLEDFQKVLVTGGAGFIGSHLAATILSLGKEAMVFDNLSAGLGSNLSSRQGVQASIRILLTSIRV